ncbi:hypothetical protein C8F04DRAFT_1293974 [Mycena alexandri]|uniref:Uncharacterized protein n=1 Tax=Mycena alexandri TaxID=1745969 RepID=A0AAD6WWW6_9AGAR|nr:hypothetical protein C8F04DRAFT_1293974 [Mycena alexandri]
MGKAGAAFRHNPGTTKTKRAAGAADPNILLYAPGSATPIMHTWSGVPYAAGAYTVSLLPKWWNATASCSLQLMVLPASTPAFLSTIPAGPVFTATYTAPATGIPALADMTQGPNNGGMTVVGKKAAAVILPLLFVLLLGLAYLKISRAKGAAKRSAWSEKLAFCVDWVNRSKSESGTFLGTCGMRFWSAVWMVSASGMGAGEVAGVRGVLGVGNKLDMLERVDESSDSSSMDLGRGINLPCTERSGYGGCASVSLVFLGARSELREE